MAAFSEIGKSASRSVSVCKTWISASLGVPFLRNIAAVFSEVSGISKASLIIAVIWCYIHNLLSCVYDCDRLSYFHLYVHYLLQSLRYQLPVGFIAELVEHCTGIAEVMGSRNPLKPNFFFEL